MPVLWLKFPDEVLFSAHYREEDRKKLEAIFSPSNPQSPWRKALDLLGMRQDESCSRLLAWHGGAPYFNWSCMASAVSGGTVRAVPAPDGSYRFETHYGLRGLWRLIAMQWTTTRFLEVSQRHEDSIELSIALGLVIQLLILRMGPQAQNLGTWLCQPAAAPHAWQHTIAQIQSLQMRRTAMSPVWRAVLPNDDDEHQTGSALPDYFWDEAPAPYVSAAASLQHTDGPWKGLSVCAGTINGLAVVMPRRADMDMLEALKKTYNAPLILIFPFARPETVEFFPAAAAVLFCEGGVLSHACTVARDRRLPCVTGLGKAFLQSLPANDRTWLNVDGSMGSVSIISEK